MVKKITFSLLLSISAGLVTQAQSNLNFENWNGNEPNGWLSSNQITTANGGSQTVFKQVTSPGQGTASVKLVTGSCPDCPNFSIFGPFGGFTTPLPNPLGGSIQLGQPQATGIPYSQRPISVDFRYKSNPQGNDAGGFQVELTRWNAATGETETVGEGYFEANSSVSTWTNMNIPISYSLTATPDTMNIFATSSIGSIPDLSSFGLPSPSSLGLPTPVAGSEFYLDGIVFNLPSCAGFSVTITGTNETALGANDGSASANPSGGTAPYSYAWSNLSSTQTISNLMPGYYSVTVTDNNQCQKVVTRYVAPGGCNLSASVSGTNSSSNSIFSGSGTATVTAAGGNPPYNYEWSTGASTTSISSLAVGTYAVLVTEQINSMCAVWGYYTVFGPNGATGIQKSTYENAFSIYPNPTTGKFVFETTEIAKNGLSIEIYNVSGGMVFKQKNIKPNSKSNIDISSVSKGTYLVRINDGTSVLTKQIVVE